MPEKSAGILVYRFGEKGGLEVLLAHPGGPYWARRDLGAWTIPKGKIEEGEDRLAAALREFREETGFSLEEDGFLDLGSLRQSSGKIVHAWAAEADLDPARATSNTFELEWPKNSGSVKSYPEIDRLEWFSLKEAEEKIIKGQRGFLATLEEKLAV